MFFRQFYDQPLAQASYLIGCQATGEAVVVDPLRDVAAYLQVASAEGLRISHVTETHIHADFVSGARELVAASGARLFLSAEGGTDWQYRFAARDGATLLRDGDTIMVGNIRLDVLHTPGHTPEHLSFVVTDTPRAAGAMGILTGDFVFVGDVGRPDLLERAAGIANTMEAGAHTLFHSLERFRALPDHLQVWPAHGAGSACGKALGAVPSSTVGYEKRSNWGVAETDEAQFVVNVLDGQPEPPGYFAEMKRINREGPPVLGGMTTPARLAATDIVTLATQTWVLDLRPAAAFAAAHIPSSLSLPYSRSFSTYTGTLVPYDVDIVLLAPSAAGEGVSPVAVSAAHDLALIGLDRVVGWVDADEAVAAWTNAGHQAGTVTQMNVRSLEAWSDEAITVLDVRGESEWREGHLPHALHVPLGQLASQRHALPSTTLVLQCQSGARSAIAASLLKRLGRDDVVNLEGGYLAWRESRRPTTT
ncbi:MAG: MBL fold metallo-hydrolase [Gemmatimonadaceae bacterium]|nr:MBL fold metallo-hydrolase [Gemmatimonadaceae bacterium]